MNIGDRVRYKSIVEGAIVEIVYDNETRLPCYKVSIPLPDTPYLPDNIMRLPPEKKKAFLWADEENLTMITPLRKSFFGGRKVLKLFKSLALQNR